jgi:uncharacterized membrane protein YfcA
LLNLDAGALSFGWPLLVLLLAGVAAGFINTMAGGGSMLTLPALMLLGLPADLANGSNRLAVISQSVAGVTSYHRADKLDTGNVAPILAPTILGALAGAWIAAVVPTAYLEPALLGTMLVMATVIVLRPSVLEPGEDEQPADLWRSPKGLAGLLLAGVYAGFVQAGVGFVLLTVLSGVLRYDLVRANALKLVCTLVFGVVACGVFAWHGQIAWLPGLVLAGAAVAGSLLGVRFALDVDKKILRWIVFVMIVAMVVAVLVRGR